MAGTRFDIVTIDAVDTRALARFWCAVLDAKIVEDEDDARWLCLAVSGGRRVLGLQRTSSESAALRETGRAHLDLACEPKDFEGERARILSLGATETRPARVEHYGSIANFADLEGNLFDLCAYV